MVDEEKTYEPVFNEIVPLLMRAHNVRKIAPGEYDISSSRMANFCPRESALAFEDRATRKEVHDGDMRYIMGTGQGFHDALQNHILGTKGLIRGVWRCTLCNTIHGSYEEGGRIRMPKACKKCGSFKYVDRELIFRYVEDELIDPGTAMVCHPDGYRWDGILYEFKSVTIGTDIRIMNAPLPEHVVQTQMNMHLQRTVRKNPVPFVHLIYFAVGAGMLLRAVTEYHVKYSKSLAERYYARAEELARYRVFGKPMPRRICASPDDERAQKCQMRTVCFG